MLTETQVNDFHTKGYLVVENLLDQTSLEAIRAEYAALMDRLYAGWQAEGLVPELATDADFWEKLDHCYKGDFDWFQPFDISLPGDGITKDTQFHFGPAVFDMVRNKRILDLVQDLIGPELTSNPIQHVRIKPPERAVDQSEIRAHVVSTDWHQDMGVTNREADQTDFITVWLAITDATLENGCLQVAPGVHPEMMQHCPVRKQLSIPDSQLPKDSATPVPVRAGGAVIFHPLTPHASLANTSDGYRWSFDLRYNVTGQPTGRGHFPDFVVRSPSKPESVLQDWRRWREMWEEARAASASAPHIAQHGRWDADSPYCA